MPLYAWLMGSVCAIAIVPLVAVVRVELVSMRHGSVEIEESSKPPFITISGRSGIR